MRTERQKPMSHKARLVAALPMFIAAVFVASLAVGRPAHSGSQTQGQATRPTSPRLYVFDCGKLKLGDTSVYGFAPNDLATAEMSVPCFLVAHPKGTLMWDAGVLPDKDLTSGQSVSRGNPA